MAKVRDYHKLALDIIDVVGGQKNIVNATRCATRLRLVLKETPEADLYSGTQKSLRHIDFCFEIKNRKDEAK